MCYTGLVLLVLLCMAPDLHPTSRAMATSVDLILSSDVTEDDIRVVEKEVKIIHFNYTLNVTGNANHSLSLAVCVSVDDMSVAQASVHDDAIVPLHTDLTGSFNVSVRGVFVGRAHVHVHFVLGQGRVRCEEPGPDNLQELLRVSEDQRGKEVPMNVSKPSPTTSSSTVGLHSGRKYTVVVLRAERVIDVVFNVCIVIIVVVINVGMGSKLDLQVVKATLKRPFAPITGILSQFVIMPLVSFAMTRAFKLTPGIALGFFALGCSPGGSSSNAFCYMLGGDVSLSITMTFISTIASFGMLPLWFGTLGRHIYGVNEVKIPFDNIIFSLLGLVAAVTVGLVLKHKKPRLARIAVTASKVAIGVMIVFMCTVGIYANLYIFSLMRGELMAAAAVLPYAGFILGGLVALILRLSTKHVITIAIETGIQNTGVAIIVLLLSLDHPESDLSIVAPAASSLFTPIPLWIAVAVVKIRRCYRRKKGLDEDAAATPDADRDQSPQDPTPSTGESLCKKLFGEGNTGEVGCGLLCLYCRQFFRDREKDSATNAEDVETGPKERRSIESSAEKPDAAGIENLALEPDRSDPATDKDSSTTAAGEQDASDPSQSPKAGSLSDGGSVQSDHSSVISNGDVPCNSSVSPSSASGSGNGKKDKGDETYV